MDLTIDEAAVAAMKTARQIRHLINTGQLQATKEGGRWRIRSQDLNLPQRLQPLQQAVAVALGSEASQQIASLKAFQLGAPLLKELTPKLGAAHPAATAFQNMLVQLAQGCHRFHPAEKLVSYRSARDLASTAVCLLLIEEQSDLANTIEQQVIPAITGLIRRLDKP
jgi:hypothetical protein